MAKKKATTRTAKATKELWKAAAGKDFKMRPLLRERDSSEDRVEVDGKAASAQAAAAKQRLAAIEALSGPAAGGFTGPTAPVVGSRNWTPLGPLAIPNGQTYTIARVNVSGRVTGIAIDPTDTRRIYIGTAQGGVWKTVDAGVNWAPMSDNEASLAIGAVTLDPNDAQVVYAGTGEGNFSGDSYYGLGVLKSTNGGATWTLQG
ncbi:MAG: hypothetical protein U0R19_38450 [Bryobacteraceae bacterium]